MTDRLRNLKRFQLTALLTALLLICFSACLGATLRVGTDTLRGKKFSTVKNKKKNELRVGIDVLQEKKFSTVKNKKIALLTHAAALSSQKQLTLDIFLASRDVQLKVLLLPEHNGGFSDGKLEEVKKMGISVYPTHRPTSRAPELEWLKGVDSVVIDVQDIGVRFYTYSSSVLYTMAKAFEAGKECVILDRPNPLGDYIGGPPMDKQHLCFLGPIPEEPLFPGITIAEIANFVKNCGQDFDIKCTCGMNDCNHGIFCSASTLKKGKLTVVKNKGWQRKKILTEFGSYSLESAINLSPSIQNVASIFEYALSGLTFLLGENFIKFLNAIKNPRHPGHNFKYFHAPHVSASNLLKSVTSDYSFALKGCQLQVSKIGNDASSISGGEFLELSITKFSSTEPAILSLALLAFAQEWISDADWEAFEKAALPAASTAAKTPPALANATKTTSNSNVKNPSPLTTSAANGLGVKNPPLSTASVASELPNNVVIIPNRAPPPAAAKTPPALANVSGIAMSGIFATNPARDLKKLTPAQQKALRKAKWDRLTKLQRGLVQKHIGDDELLDKLFSGESIDVNHFRNKWALSATHFYNKTKKYYLY
ncbi:MAG: DUF1343 domain-containing protein [Puniceicoccales bacterium]|jgi:uncharacterized protein YbbC (DUF1343 family)|nr:DUF1343 domain-containing protein [Puniceicoccales bacterium]